MNTEDAANIEIRKLIREELARAYRIITGPVLDDVGENIFTDLKDIAWNPRGPDAAEELREGLRGRFFRKDRRRA